MLTADSVREGFASTLAKTKTKLKIFGSVLVVFCLVACADRVEFEVSKSDAESGRGSSGFDFLESFGESEGPFKSQGGPNGHYGSSISFYVTVGGEKIERNYTPEDDSYAYAADFYTNKDGDGFAVVHKIHREE
ncbi:MAG: hypothetical protein AAGJ81_08870 [Verrucomicrobiota bacterium]